MNMNNAANKANQLENAAVVENAIPRNISPTNVIMMPKTKAMIKPALPILYSFPLPIVAYTIIQR